MAYKKKSKGKRYRRRYGKSARKLRKSTKSLASRAFKLAKRLQAHSEETKLFSYAYDADVAGAPVVLNLTDLGNYSALFQDADGYLNGPTVGGTTKITGNKAWAKSIKGRWEVHMDNLNNEEETVNFTLAVVSFKRDADATVQRNGVATALTAHTAYANGQAYFDSRAIRVHYYKYFTRTMGGTSPGTAGESVRWGKFTIPMKKMIRFSRATPTADPNGPADLQDNRYFVICTDNTSVDTENPRINAHFLFNIKDSDVFNK